MVSNATRLPAGCDPDIAAPTIVSCILAASSDQFVVGIASRLLLRFWKGTYRTPYYATIAISADECREKAQILRVKPELTMNEIFDQFGMLDSSPLTEEQWAAGNQAVPITCMEAAIENLLYQVELNSRDRPARSSKRWRPKSRKEKEVRYQMRKQKRLAKKQRQRLK